MTAEQGLQRASAVIDRRYRSASFQLWVQSFSTFRASPPPDSTKGARRVGDNAPYPDRSVPAECPRLK